MPTKTPSQSTSYVVRTISKSRGKITELCDIIPGGSLSSAKAYAEQRYRTCESQYKARDIRIEVLRSKVPSGTPSCKYNCNTHTLSILKAEVVHTLVKGSLTLGGYESE